MRYLRGDIMTTIEALQQRGRPGVTPPTRAIADFCVSFFKPMRYDYLDWKDPLPAFIATTDFTRRWLGGAIMKRLSRARGILSSLLLPRIHAGRFCLARPQVLSPLRAT